MPYIWNYEDVKRGDLLETVVIDEVLIAIDAVENKVNSGCNSNYASDNAGHDSAYNASLTNYANSSKNSTVHASNWSYGPVDCSSNNSSVHSSNQSAANASNNNLKCVNSFSCTAHS